ncbi:MAG TPA: cupin [Corynebacterium pollutisoli]|uniref:Acireductone dioxygenase n=1 Tax=Corynebacterium pollutisoli TaxID=1610489 RepID=A0A7X8MXZ7_9CORY|nr:cupin [Corynebacterium pollutisoli]HJD79037.1 cupin [Corynebacterium pollutisoli]
MTLLYKWNASAPDTELLRTAQPEEIAAELNTLGVRYEQWPTQELADDADQEAVLAAYADEVARISAEENFVTVDVARLRNTGQPDFAETARAAREKFLDEHTHADDEVRFFVEGSGTFYLHIDDTVYAVVCERGDLLSVPEGSTHWFDMGVADPQFCAIRFFHDGEGWVGDFTGEKISARFPGHDELLAGK